jgi:hypothetical protein
VPPQFRQPFSQEKEGKVGYRQQAAVEFLGRVAASD